MLRPGQTIALCALALLTIGVIMVNSAGMRVTPVAGPTPQDAILTPRDIIFSRPTAYMGMAVIAMAAAAFLPIRRLARSFDKAGPDGLLREPPARPDPFAGLVGPGIIIAGLLILMALVYVPGVSRVKNGSHRWISLPIPGLSDALSVQPSEIAKWVLIGLAAWYGITRASVLHKFWRGLVPALIGVGAVAGFIVLEDLGTGVLIACAACFVLVAAGARIWQFAMMVPAAAALLAAAVITSPYRVKRLTAFLDPYADPEKTGYHMIQSMLAVHGGEGPGRGLGHGLQKFGYLPEDKTDFLFAVICEELGIAGAAIIIALFIGLIWAGYLIVKREPRPILKLFVSGVIVTVGLQALINLAVVTGLGPTKGIALPLVSSGGTGWILTAFCLGLVIAVDRTQAHLFDSRHVLIEPRGDVQAASAAVESAQVA
ncbi:MAG: FtsW/RodA/SpoVE family cell cycle protein [Phycisphaerales bacterium]|nr:FtsW/RodA/SpoVE family cell cycle protein [Phycisphaerales bacterium]